MPGGVHRCTAMTACHRRSKAPKVHALRLRSYPEAATRSPPPGSWAAKPSPRGRRGKALFYSASWPLIDGHPSSTLFFLSSRCRLSERRTITSRSPCLLWSRTPSTRRRPLTTALASPPPALHRATLRPFLLTGSTGSSSCPCPFKTLTYQSNLSCRYIPTEWVCIIFLVFFGLSTGAS